MQVTQSVLHLARERIQLEERLVRDFWDANMRI